MPRKRNIRLPGKSRESPVAVAETTQGVSALGTSDAGVIPLTEMFGPISDYEITLTRTRQQFTGSLSFDCLEPSGGLLSFIGNPAIYQQMFSFKGMLFTIDQVQRSIDMHGDHTTFEVRCVWVLPRDAVFTDLHLITLE